MRAFVSTVKRTMRVSIELELGSSLARVLRSYLFVHPNHQLEETLKDDIDPTVHVSTAVIIMSETTPPTSHIYGNGDKSKSIRDIPYMEEIIVSTHRLFNDFRTD